MGCEQIVDGAPLIHVGQAEDDGDIAILPCVLAVDCAPVADIELEVVGTEGLCERLGVLEHKAPGRNNLFYSEISQADAYAGYGKLYEPGRKPGSILEV